MTFSSTTTGTMLKIILDTNVILSASLFGGMTEMIIDLILENKLRLYISPDLSKEVLKKLNEFEAEETIVDKVITVLNKGILITPNIKATVCRDPKDNYILELAQTCKADYIITRDKDLLELPNQKWKNTKITKPEQFLVYLRKKKLLK